MSRPTDNQRSLPKDRLFQKMSEVISLREQVAQAELAVRAIIKTDPNRLDKLARPEKEN
jgi:hypothetical protein